MSDILELKLALFEERCDQNEIPPTARGLCFSAMLAEGALQYYFTEIKNRTAEYVTMVRMLKQRFITPEREIALTREWSSIRLIDYIRKHKDKTPLEALELMVARLSALRITLPRPFQADIMLRNRLLDACAEVKECRLARQKVSNTVEGVIADLQTSMSTYSEPSRTPPNAIAAMITDRQRQPPNLSNRWGRNKPGRKCFVCHKIGCWSTKHTPSERLRALSRNKKTRAFILDAMGDEEQGQTDNDEAEELETVIAHLTDLHQLDSPDSDADAGSEPPDTHPYTSAFISDATNCLVAHTVTRNRRFARYPRSQFFGVAIDTCCSHASTGGYEQYQAYCSHVGIAPNIRKDCSRSVLFGIGKSRTLGTADCSFPLGPCFVSFTISVVDADVPILLSLHDMDRLKVKYDNLSDVIVHAPTQASTQVTRKFGHPFICWNSLGTCLFTEQELRRLHRRFGHPSALKLLNVLRRAKPDDIDGTTRKMLEKISSQCYLCQFEFRRPRRFKFTVQEDKDFNHSVYVDVMWLNKKPILHCVDEATKYQAARWIPDHSSKSVWRAFRLCWLDVYLGPPDVIVHDAAKNLLSQELQNSATLLHIRTKAVPVESANSLSVVERYHNPLRRSFRIIKGEVPDLDDEAALQYAVKALNDSTGPDGLVPTLLVYGALPRLGLPTDQPSPSLLKRAIAVAKASEALSRQNANRQISAALSSRNGPDITDIHKLPLGCHVLVYRVHRDKWEGPYALLSRDRESCTVLCPNGPSVFRTTVVKPYHKPPPETDTGTGAPTPPTPVAYLSGIQNHTNMASKFEILTASTEKHDFTDARQRELNGLLNGKCLAVVSIKDAAGHRLYGTRFEDKVKFEGLPEQTLKSRLVLQGHNDRNHGLITQAPTVQRSSQRLLLALAPTLFRPPFNFGLFQRDITQAYTQSETPARRRIFARPPPEMRLSPDKVLRIVYPLYGLTEAGTLWFNTYHQHHTKRLGLTYAAHDMCLLHTTGNILKRNNAQPASVTCLQTDDTLTLANSEYITNEKREAARFKSKPIERITEGTSFRFNGTRITRTEGTLVVDVQEHISNLRTVRTGPTEKKEYIAQRARGAYVASHCRPDLSYGFSYAAQHTKPTREHISALNKMITKCADTAEVGLRFVPLSETTIHIATFIDASFGRNADLSSQLGYIICLMDDKGRANIVHYASQKCKRVTRSVLAAELYAMVLGYDISFVIHKAVSDMLGRKIPLKLYTDSRCLFDSLTTLNTTTEKRLLIDLNMLRQSYEERNITEVVWIPGTENPADGFTKDGPCPALHALITENKISINPNAWVERPTKFPHATHSIPVPSVAFAPHHKARPTDIARPKSRTARKNEPTRARHAEGRTEMRPLHSGARKSNQRNEEASAHTKKTSEAKSEISNDGAGAISAHATVGDGGEEIATQPISFCPSVGTADRGPGPLQGRGTGVALTGREAETVLEESDDDEERDEKISPKP